MTITRSTDETLAIASQVGELLRPGDLVVLAGDLGAGKTTFARGIARGLDVTDPVVSPTFTIVREYAGRVPFVHIDVYRLDNLQELYDLGLDELLRDDAVTVVEWGDVVSRLLPRERLEVKIELGASDDERVVDLTPRGPSWHDRAAKLTRNGAA